MILNDLRIRAMDGSVLVDGRFRLEGDPAGMAAFAMPDVTAIGVRLWPRNTTSWAFLGFEQVQQGGDGLWAASAPTFSVELTRGVPSLAQIADLFLPQGRSGISIGRKGSVRLGSINLPLAAPQPGKSPSAYLQFGAVDLEVDVQPTGLQIDLAAQIADVIGLDGHDVSGLRLHGSVFVPALALTLHQLPKISSRDEDLPVADVQPGEIGHDDLGLSTFGNPVVEGQVDWGQNGDRFNPLGPFVDLHLQDRFMGFSPTGNVVRRSSGLLAPSRPSSDGPFMRINQGVEDLASMLEGANNARLELRGEGIGYIEGRTGRDAYEEGSLRQDLDWLTLKLERSANGLLFGGTGELGFGPRGQSTRVGKTLDFAFFLPRKLILARGLNLPGFWDDWKKDYAGGEVW